MYHPALFPYCDLCWADGELHPAEVRYWSDEAQQTFFACEAHIALLDRVGQPYEFLSEVGYRLPVIALRKEEDFDEFIMRETEAAIEGGIIDENTGLPFELEGE